MFRYAFVLAAGLAASAAAHADGSVDAGMWVFAKNCSACHSLQPEINKLGPTLAGINGREAGSLDGFNYSEGLAAETFVWTDALLLEYLSTPTRAGGGDQLLHSVHMNFEGLSPEQASDLLAFLSMF